MQSSEKNAESGSTDTVVTGSSNAQVVESTATTAPNVFGRRAFPAWEIGGVIVPSGLTRGFQLLETGRVSVSPVSTRGAEDLDRDNPEPSPSPPSPLPPLSRVITPAATSTHIAHLNRLRQLITTGPSTASDVCHAHRGWGGTTVCTAELSLRSCPDDYEWRVICSAHDQEWTTRGECTRYSDIALRQDRQEAVSWKDVDWGT